MTLSPFRLDGRRILITGASSGIGRATAIACAEAGAASCLLTGRNREALEATALILPDGCEGIVKVCDLSDTSAMEEMVAEIDAVDGKSKLPRIPLLFSQLPSQDIRMFRSGTVSMAPPRVL